MAIDFKKLRDEQIPDVNGNLIPLNLERGQIAWSQKGPASKALSGRSEQISVSGGSASSYDCRNYCQDWFNDGWIDPGTLFASVGEVTEFQAEEQDVNAYGQYLPPYPVDSVEWNSDDLAIADITGYGEAQGVSTGYTTISASWTAYELFGEVGGGHECVLVPVYVYEEAPIEVRPSVTITKIDGSPLPNPFRLGVNGGGNNRAQTLKATVTPANQASNVTIQVSSKINGSITTVNSQTGVITFNVVGNAASSSGSSCSTGDSFIRAVHSGSILVSKPVFVSVPSKVATPHDTTGTLLIANRVLDGTTTPQVHSGLGPNEVLLATVFARVLTVTVKDQCNNPIGDVYTGARVTETIVSTNVDINQPLTSASTYSDPAGATINRFIVQRGSPEAAAWPTQPLTPMVAGSQTQNIAVQVDGFTLIPAIVNRTWTLTPPSTVTITWPN